MNIRFLKKPFECLYDYLSLLPNFFKMICPTATRLKQQPLTNIDLTNYELFNYNFLTPAGGILVYDVNEL